MKNENIMIAVGAGVLLLILGVVIWWNLLLWDECRATNSFWYCIRVIWR